MSPTDFSVVPSKIGKKSSKIADSGLNAENFMFLKVIERMGMLPFVIYRLLLGVGLIVFLTL